LTDTIFLAGAAGVIGRILGQLLVTAGWRVVGTTRSPDRTASLESLGVEPAVLDVYDAAALKAAVAKARPRIVVHQLTDLPPSSDPAGMAAARERNARIREVGTRHLVEAAVAAGAQRLIAQSIAFAYAPGPTPHIETDALNVAAEGPAGITARGVASLEAQVMAAPLHAMVLRYGRLYGPATGADAPPGPAPLHVEEAARVALLALTRGAPGIYNIAVDDGYADVAKAARELGWRAGARAGQA
jgi:nucleoside-diphosphate-sugar epimerase